MKILFLTDNFPPEVNAPAIRTFEHCKEWVRQGAEVTVMTVITCFPDFTRCGGRISPDGQNISGRVVFYPGRLVRLSRKA